MAHLPMELWLIIAQEHLDEQSVKQLRLVSTVHAQLLTPLFFEVLRLKPDIDSLGKALKVVETPLLARHVHVLEIYSRIVPDVGYPNATMEGLMRTHIDLKEKYPALPMVDITIQPRQYFYSYLSIRAKQTAYRQACPFDELLHILRQLPNLESIQQPDLALLLEEIDGQLPLHIGIAAKFSDNFELQRALVSKQSAAAFQSLKSLSIAWDLSMHEQLWDPQAFTFDILETLELHVIKTYDRFANKYAFEQFLQSVRNVSNLVISNRKQLESHASLENPEWSISKAWAAAFNQHFPNLKRLWLRLIVCTEEDLASFLLDHRATLEELSMQDLILRNWKRPLLQVECDNSVVRLLWLLKHLLNLRDFELHNHIGSDGIEYWKADGDRQNGAVLGGIVASICHGRASPFKDYASYVLPAAWLRLLATGPAGHDKEMDDCQSSTNSVQKPLPWSDTLVPLVKTDLREFSVGNITALADSLPASPEGFKLMLEEVKAYSDVSWTFMDDEEAPSEQPVDGVPMACDQSSDTS